MDIKRTSYVFNEKDITPLSALTVFGSVALSVVELGNGVKLLLQGQSRILSFGYSIYHTVTSVETHTNTTRVGGITRCMSYDWTSFNKETNMSGKYFLLLQVIWMN